MEFDLRRLLSNVDSEIVIDETYEFSPEELKGTGIIRINNLSIKGNITKDSLNDLVINITIDGIMILPCALTLKEVEYPFNVEVDGNIEEMLDNLDKNSKKVENTLDILPIIWENILMEIPSRVVSPDAENIEMSGDGWKLVKEVEMEENPELAKLKDLL